MSINQITKFCRVSEHTVRAVRDREAVSIAERKQRLMSIFGNVAEMAAERMEELAVVRLSATRALQPVSPQTSCWRLAAIPSSKSTASTCTPRASRPNRPV